MSRLELDILKAMPEFQGKKIVPAFLRKDVALVNGQSTIQFPLIKNSGVTINAAENLLDYKDAIAITHYGLFLVFETVGQEGKGRLFTFPNSSVFTGAGLTLADLEKLYNGKLTLRNGQDQLLEAYPTKNFRVERTSATEAVPADGFATAAPMIIFKGNDKIDLRVERPATSGEGVQLTTTTTNIVKAVFFAQGYVIYGAGGQ